LITARRAFVLPSFLSQDLASAFLDRS